MVGGRWCPWLPVANEGQRARGQGVLHVSGKLVDRLLNVVYLYVYLSTD